MSMFATLLFDRPVILPQGVKRRHLMEDGARRDPEIEYATTNKNVLIMMRNTETVHAAVAAGCTTHAAIEDHTGLSQSTVKKALYRLEGWPDGPRISRDRRQPAHRFEVC